MPTRPGYVSSRIVASVLLAGWLSCAAALAEPPRLPMPMPSAPPKLPLPSHPPPVSRPPQAPPPARMPDLPSFRQAEIRVLVNGSEVRFDVPPMMGEGGVYVPLRGVFEKMGATVDYRQSTGQITAQRGETVVLLTVGSKLARIGGETAVMLQPAVASGGRTLVPLRFVSQALGAAVEWNPARREVEITVTEKPHRPGKGH